MSFKDSSLWQNILSPDQRWMPTQYRSSSKRSIYICEHLARPKPLTRCQELHNKEIQQKQNINHVNQIQSSLAKLKSRGDISRAKFSKALCQYPGPTKPTDLNIEPSEQPKESACSGRKKFNHLRGSVLMFPQLQQHLKEANQKYLVTYRAGYLGGPGEARELMLVPRIEPEVVEVEVPPEEVAVEEVKGEDEENEATDEVGEEEGMKEVASKKSLSIRMISPGCWIDDATVSSLSGRSKDDLAVPVVDKRAAQSPHGTQSPQGPQGTQGDTSPDENNKQRLTPSLDESVSSEDAPTTTLQTTQARSPSENPEGTQITQPEPAEEPPLEKADLSSVHEPDTTNTVKSWQESETTDGSRLVTSPVLPTYICPSSTRKSHVTEIKRWLNKSTFTSAPELLPLI